MTRKAAFAVVVTIVGAARLFAQDAISFSGRMRELASGCVVSTLSCGTTESGELAPGDCTFSDGTRYDTWHFAGNAGQQITLNLRTVDASYTMPQLYLVPPIGDASQTPAVLGAPPLGISYTLASTGTWTVAVATGDLFASGRYTISMDCGTPRSGDPQNCVAQPLACDQSYVWSVTASSCQFTGGGWAFAPFNMRMTKGDYVSFTAESDAYDPAIAIYRNGGQPLIYNYGRRSTTDAVIYFTAPDTATYEITAYGATPQSAGEFVLSSSCISVCGPPTITSQPGSQTVPYGGSATVTVAATSPNGQPTTYNWFDNDSIGIPTSIGSSTSLTLASVTSIHHLYAQAQSSCGFTNSSIAVITPASCDAPTITGQPSGATIAYGQLWLTGVAVAGAQPMSFQWYQGMPPDTSRPVDNNHLPLLNGTALYSGPYWVRVTNVCGSADSQAAILVVTGGPRGRVVRH